LLDVGSPFSRLLVRHPSSYLSDKVASVVDSPPPSGNKIDLRFAVLTHPYQFFLFPFPYPRRRGLPFSGRRVIRPSSFSPVRVAEFLPAFESAPPRSTPPPFGYLDSWRSPLFPRRSTAFTTARFLLNDRRVFSTHGRPRISPSLFCSAHRLVACGSRRRHVAFLLFLCCSTPSAENALPVSPLSFSGCEVLSVEPEPAEILSHPGAFFFPFLGILIDPSRPSLSSPLNKLPFPDISPRLPFLWPGEIKRAVPLLPSGGAPEFSFHAEQY